MDPPTRPVVEAAHTFGVALEGPLAASLTAYLARLLEVNRSMNLTAITDPDEAWTKHVLDSLSLMPWLAALPAEAAVIDVGSGGGLPAIPLALAAPELRFTLVEATGKKARFLSETAHSLGLRNVEVIAERAETVGRGALRERFRLCTARAVSRLPVLLELTLPLLEVGGRLIAIKGSRAELELREAERALDVLGGAVGEVRRTDTGTLLAIDKQRPTPARYPRRPGEPKRAPLGGK